VSFEAEMLLGRFRARGSRLLVPTLLLALAAFLAMFLAGKITEQWINIAVYSVCGLLALFGFVFPTLRYLTSWTDITTSRVVSRSGLFGQNYRTVSFENIERVELSGSSRIVLYVAGESSLELIGLPKAKLIAQEISGLCGPRH
jgi:hypothetical protein